MGQRRMIHDREGQWLKKSITFIKFLFFVFAYMHSEFGEVGLARRGKRLEGGFDFLFSLFFLSHLSFTSLTFYSPPFLGLHGCLLQRRLYFFWIWVPVTILVDLGFRVSGMGLFFFLYFLNKNTVFVGL